MALPPVRCARCKTDYPAFSQGQANGCAATVGPDGITGHYGSEVADMELLVATNSTALAGLSMGDCVCDTCLTTLLGEGLLAFVDIDRTAAIAAHNAEMLKKLRRLDMTWETVEDIDPKT